MGGVGFIYTIRSAGTDDVIRYSLRIKKVAEAGRRRRVTDGSVIDEGGQVAQ